MKSYTSTNQMSLFQKIKHHLLVERDGFAPLKYGNGEFIYRKQDRHLAGRGPLSELEEIAMKERDVTNSEKGNVVITKYLLTLIYQLITIFSGVIFGAKVFIGLLIIGLILML